MVDKLKLYQKGLFSKYPMAKYLIGGLIISGVWLSISILYKDITIDVDGKTIEVATFKGTVQGVLSQNLIEVSSKDKVEPSLDSKIHENESIKITRARNVAVKVDGKDLMIQSSEDTVNDMFQTEGIKINDMDRVEPDLDTAITDDLQVSVTRIEEKVIKEIQPIAYETIVKKDDSVTSNVIKTSQKGVAGEKEVTFKVMLEDGIEVGRNVIEELVLKEPVQEVVVKGTMQTLVLSRGDTISYKKKMNMEATAYAGDPVTATGTVPKRNPNGLSTIAVDPRVIPLGSKVYVEGYGYAVAEDTGGAIKNNIIDVFLNSESECNRWGRKRVNVYLIAYPGQW